MTLLRKNLLSNLVGQGAVAILSLIFIPFYISLMGVESYAIVGIFASLQAIFAIMDLGLSQTLGREVAVQSTRDSINQLPVLARTLEWIYGIGALFVFICIAGAAEYLAFHWLKPVELEMTTVQRALWVVGVVVALRWPLTLYMGGLYGLQRQALLNSLLVSFTLLQTVGALVVLIVIAPTVETFFIWQAISAFIQMAVTRWFFWKSLPHGDAKFSLSSLRHTWRYAAGITAITILSTILTQIDKLVLTRMIDLKEFGYYMLASTAAAVIYKISNPVFNAFLPRLVQLHTLGDDVGLLKTYRLGYQLLALLLIPCSLILAGFSKVILSLWTNDPDLVENTSLIFSLLVIGNTINSTMVMPYALQLAHSWTKLSIFQNIFAALVFTPMVYFLVKNFGAVGAAYSWILLNIACMLGGLYAMHLKLLPKEQRPWYRDALLVPLAGGALGMAVSFILPSGETIVYTLFRLMIASVLIITSTALALPVARKYLIQRLYSTRFTHET